MRLMPIPILLLAVAFLSAAVDPEKKSRSGSEEIIVQAPSRSPDKSLRGWHEYRSEHFWVDSNLPSFVIRGLVEQLDKLRAAELSLAGSQQVAIPGRVRVIASSVSSVRDLGGDEYLVGSGPGCRQLLNVPCYLIPRLDPCAESPRFRANYFVSRLGEPTIILPVEGLTVNSEVVAHEVAHHLASHLFLNAPAWLREGFALFMQTFGSEPVYNSPITGSHIVRGEGFILGAAGVPAPAFEHALCREWISADDVLQWRGSQSAARPGQLHIQSWLLYSWLRNDKPKELAQYQQRLGSGEDAAAAWREAFAEFDPEREGAIRSLDKALRHYFRVGGGLYFRANTEANVSFQEAPLSATDVHALLIDAGYATRPPGEESRGWLRSELRNLLQEGPLQPVALAWRAELDHSSRPMSPQQPSAPQSRQASFRRIACKPREPKPKLPELPL
jgi:hypothetical protein